MHVLLYITFPDKTQASEAARLLLEKKLIACANILPEHDSLYEWDGEVVEEKEVIMLAKTASDKFEQVKELVASNHKYDTPCIIAVDINNADPKFLGWIDKMIK